MKSLLCATLLASILLDVPAARAVLHHMDVNVWGAIKLTVLDAGLSSPPRVVKTVNPKWPAVTRQPHCLVTLEFTVDPAGAVREIRAVGVQEEVFVAAAEFAVGQWKFTPGTKDGVIVATRMQVTIPFKTVTPETRPGAFPN